MHPTKIALRALCPLVALLSAAFVHAQTAPIWSSTWTSIGNASDVPELVRATPDGGAIVVAASRGLSNRLQILRYGADGTLLWQQQDCAPTQQGVAIFLSEIPPVDLVIADDGTAVLAVICVDSSGAMALRLRKFSVASSTLIWQVQRNLSATGSNLRSPLLARDLAANRIVVAVDDQGDYLILRYDEAGQASPEIRSGANDTIDTPTAIGLQADAGIVVTGLEDQRSLIRLGYRTVGFNADGSERFVDRQLSVTRSVSALAYLSIDVQGDITIAAGPESTCGLPELAVIRLSANGQRLWTRIGDGPCSNNIEERPQWIQALADQSLLVASEVRVGGQGFIAVQRITAMGTRVWRRVAPDRVGVLESAAANLSTARIRAVGRDSMAEWSFGGVLCQSTPQAFNRSARVFANGANWLVAHTTPFSQVTNEDLRLTLFPRLPCADDGLLIDGFE
jgi:hypothetical protein